MKTLAPLLLCILLGWHMPVVAEPVDFNLLSTTGKRISLSDYRGRWVVINFWATWCIPCVKEIPELHRFQTKHPEIQVLGINFEQKKSVELRPFIKKHAFNYPLLLIGDLPLTPFEPLKGLPTTAVIDPEGNMVSKHTGPVSERMLERFFRKENIIAE
jgi:thiol-disulfide isomerase/thioredoxin